MAIAVDSTSQGGGPTLSHTCSGSNRALLVGLLGSVGSDTVTGASYNSIAMTLVDKILTPTDRYIYLFYLKAPDTGTHDIAYSGSGVIEITGVSYTGVGQNNAVDSSNTGSTSSASSLTVSTTVVDSNCWLVGMVNANNVTMSMGAGTFARKIDAATPGGIIDSDGTVGTGSQSLAVSMSPNRAIAMVICSLSPTTAITTNIKTVNGLAQASVKTVNGLAIASVKTINGLT